MLVCNDQRNVGGIVLAYDAKGPSLLGPSCVLGVVDLVDYDFVSVWLELFDLERIELDGGFAAKHGNHDFELALACVDFGDGAVEAFEWAINNRNNFADFVVDGIFWIFDTHALFDLGDFLFGNWGGLSTIADEAGDTRRVANDIPGFVGKAHFDKDVALENFAVNDFALAIFDLDLLFLWYESTEDFSLEFGAI